MLTKFLLWWYSVDSVLRNFERTVRKLERAQALHQKHAAVCSAVIKRREEMRDASEKEASRADAVATRIKALAGL